jgi:membrane-bound lytic murein transglycosylase A
MKLVFAALAMALASNGAVAAGQMPVSGSTALTSGVAAGPIVTMLPISDSAARRTLTAFALSCPGLMKREDLSGLTMARDWDDVCLRARTVRPADALRFFQQNFASVRIGAGSAFATGYYEPEIAGSRVKDAAHQVPIYRRPPDLIDIDLGQFSATLKGRKLSGRIANGAFVPFDDRAMIEAGSLTGRGLELGWAADPVELFFLQVQGSGRLRLPGGAVMRIGYNGQNGHDYTGIGKLMKERGLIEPGQASMQGIMHYLRDHPDDGRAIMLENKSWVFFREITGPGPIGAMGVAVSANTSVAADPAYVPLGAPVVLTMDRPDASGLWIAQDTGGAIKGANRFDTFWGAGDAARLTAGGMAAHGTALILLPKPVLARMARDGRTTP